MHRRLYLSIEYLCVCYTNISIFITTMQFVWLVVLNISLGYFTKNIAEYKQCCSTYVDLFIYCYQLSPLALTLIITLSKKIFLNLTYSFLFYNLLYIYISYFYKHYIFIIYYILLYIISNFSKFM